jgi:hypothetical protein
MTDVANGRPPALAMWTEVDPARHPFDPVEVPAVVPPLSRSDALVWVDAVGVALAERFGPWAYGWYWGPGESERLGWITDRIPAPVFVTESLLVWRRWLENLAERFDRFLPLLDPARAVAPGDVHAAWEDAITQVMTTVIASVADDDGWQGWCRRVLRWLLTAAGVPVEQAEVLVDRAVDSRLDDWVPPTAAVVGEVAQRLSRDVLGLAGIVPVARTDNWPDTWPQDRPSWRATNTGVAESPGSQRGISHG